MTNDCWNLRDFFIKVCAVIILPQLSQKKYENRKKESFFQESSSVRTKFLSKFGRFFYQAKGKTANKILM